MAIKAKKLKSVLLVTALFVTSLFSSKVTNTFAMELNGNSFSGKVNTNFDGSSTLTSEEMKDATLDIYDFTITSDYSIELQGRICYEECTSDIDIAGDLFKAELSDNTVVGDVIDKNNNFNTVILNISNSAKEEDLNISKELSGSEVLTLYLYKNGDLVLFEIVLSDLAPVCINYDLAPALTDPVVEQWWMTLLTPECASVDLEGTSTYATHSDTKYFDRDDSYTYRLSTDTSYTYHIVVTASVTGHDYGGATQVSDTSKLEVSDQYVEKNGVYLTDAAHLIVSNISVEAQLTSSKEIADYISRVDWSMDTTYKSGGLTFSFKKLTLKVGSLGSFTYTPVNNVSFNNYNWNDNDSTIKGATISFPYAIQNVGQDANIDVRKERNNATDSTLRVMNFYWTYNICYVNTSTPVSTNNRVSIRAPYYAN